MSVHIKLNHRPTHKHTSKYRHTIRNWLSEIACPNIKIKEKTTHTNGHNANCNKDYCMILKRATTTTTTFLYIFFFCKCVRISIMYTIWNAYSLLLMEDSPLSPCCYANGVLCFHLETAVQPWFASSSLICLLFIRRGVTIYFTFFQRKNWVNVRVKRLNMLLKKLNWIRVGSNENREREGGHTLARTHGMKNNNKKKHISL